MILTKKLQAEILKIYHSYWNAYLSGDMKTFASMLDDNIKVFGTAVSEVFDNKTETVQFYKATSDQMTGKAEFRNRKIKMHSIDETVLIHEQNDLFVLIENDWNFYGRARVSALLVKTPKGWKLAHQHGSFPDSRAEAGEQIAPEKIKKENLQLREAIKRRTIELEEKNRELEIETALEKVRAVALGMKKPEDMLEICKTISKQLQKLGVNEIRNVQTAIFYESSGIYMNYEYYSKHDKTFITDVDFKNHKIQSAFAKKMMKGANEEVREHLKGKKLLDWYAYQKTTNQFADKYLLKAESLNYYWYSLGPVALGISTYYPLTKEEEDLFKRFLKVFELAYRRYLDIEKAETQTREALIEASLEKVRAAATSMNKPEDLLNVCQILFKEFKTLGFDSLRNAMINIHDDEKKSFINYDYSDTIGRSTNILFYNIHPLVEKQMKKIRSADDAFSETYFTGKDLANWKKFRRHIGEKDDPRLDQKKGLFYYFYSIGIGSIGISTFGSIYEDQKALLKRFRNVFALSYQRYMDIAKAEAQAREAQIEASLERVRAHAMGLRNSKELCNIITIIFEELNKLGISLSESSIFIKHDKTRDFTCWTSTESAQLAESYNVPYFNHPILESLWTDIENNVSYREFIIEHEELLTFCDLLFTLTDFKDAPDQYKISLRSLEKIYVVQAMMNHGYLEVFGTKPLPEKFTEVLKRFTNVIDLTYTRFLDLQKAELQARESQIEAALERVRSRSMAMYNSADLSVVVYEMFTELEKLDAQLDRCFIMIVDPQTLGINWYLSGKEGLLSNNGFFVQNNSHPSHQAYLDGWRTKRKKWNYLLAGAEKKNWDDFGFMQTGLAQLPDFIKADMSGVKSIHLNISSDDFGCLIASSLSPLSEAHADIVERFTKVFNQTYTRFLDLQKAEAQNKIILAENERKTKELEDARNLQLAMLPREIPKMRDIDISVFMKTATEVGGDYYDFNVKPDGTLTIILGDATGHGMMAGMMVSVMKSLFMSGRLNLELKEFFESSNNSIKEMQLGRLMMPLMGIQITSKEVIATNAGMPSLFYFRNKSQKAGEFVSNNMPLGAMKGVKYSLKKIIYESGDTLLMMSDGFAELKNENNELFGYRRILKLFNKVAKQNPETIIEHLKEEGGRWTNGKELEDDMTFVVVKL